jgi:uncharacterized delta-60 repeat protein
VSRSLRVLAAVSAVAVLMSIMPAWAASGDADVTFSGDGKAAFKILGAGDGDSLEGVIVQPDGKAVGVGDVVPSGSGRSKALVVRLEGNGTLDPTFSGDGIAVVSLPGNTWASGVVMGPQGTILVVGGNETTERSRALVFRLTPSGKLDDAFSGDGIAFVPIAGLGYGSAIVRSGPEIYISGSVERPGKPDAMLVARFGSSGAIDGTFAGDGVVLAPFGGLDAWSNALALSDGRPVITGSVSADGNSDFSYAAARFTAGGVLDDTFAGDGKATVLVHATDWSEGQDAIVMPDGDVLIGGFTYVDPDYAHVFVRLTSAGLPDPTFGGGDGLLVSDPRPGSDWFGEMVKRGSDFVVAGSSVFDTNPDITLFGYDENGALDPTFSGNGIVRLHIAPYSVAYAIARDSEGRYVAAGRRYDLPNGVNDVAFVRVLGP